MRPKNKTISAQDTHAQVSREKLLDAAISLVNDCLLYTSDAADE